MEHYNNWHIPLILAICSFHRKNLLPLQYLYLLALYQIDFAMENLQNFCQILCYERQNGLYLDKIKRNYPYLP